MRTVVRAYFAAGATHVAPFVQPSTFYATEAEALAAIDGVSDAAGFSRVHASHPHGTCRMGPKDGPNAGVVDENGAVYGANGAYVMDGAIFPSTLGKNPQVTIMALALALSRRLAS